MGCLRTKPWGYGIVVGFGTNHHIIGKYLFWLHGELRAILINVSKTTGRSSLLL